jgi:hypothetical protein
MIKFDDRLIGMKEYSPWQQDIPDMVMKALGAIPHYKLISREYMMEKVLKEQEFQPDQKSVVEPGKLPNAQYRVIGSFSIFKDSLAINAKVLSIESGEISPDLEARKG